MMHLSAQRLGFVVLACGVVACGGKAVMDGTSSQGGNGGNGGHSTGGTATTTDTWTTWTSTTHTGGGPGCYETHDAVSVRLATYDGQLWTCDGGAAGAGTTTLQGEVLEATEGHISFDSCPPNADCMPMVNDLQYSAPGLYQNLWVGTYIEVRVAINMSWGCVAKLEIWNLPQWGGVPNPNWPNPSLWLAAVDGEPQPLSSLPFSVSKLPLDCYPGAPSCGVPKDDFVLHFAETASPGNGVDVPMGQTGQLYLGASSPADWFSIRNLRTYESGACDDNWNYAWWAMMELMYD